MNLKLPDLLKHQSLLSPLSSVAAIFAGLIAGLIIMLLSAAFRSEAFGSEVFVAFLAFETILTSGFSTLNDFGQVLYFAAPIIMTGLSVGFAAKTGLFNIGASGQFMAGAFAAVFVGVRFDFLPGHLHWIAALLAAIIAGGLWGAIPGIFKAFFNVHEVISCIMANYISMHLVNFLVRATIFDSRQNQSLRIAETANIPRMGMDYIFRDGFRVSMVNAGIIIAIVFAVIVYIVIEKTSFGYELKVCGSNREAARYAGINEKRSIVLSMVIAGALAGLGGALVFLSDAGRHLRVEDVLAPEGFLGIPAAILAFNNPIGIIFTALLIAHLNVGGFNMQLYRFAPQIIDIIIAVIIYFSAFTLLAKGFIVSIIRKKNDKTKRGAL